MARRDLRRQSPGRYRHFSAKAPGYGFVEEAVPELAIAVKEGWRGRGLGRALLIRLIDEARRRGERAVSLSVSRRNPAALRL